MDFGLFAELCLSLLTALSLACRNGGPVTNDGSVQRATQFCEQPLFSARDQQAAQEFREQVRQWWSNNKGEAPTSALGEDPPIVVKYSRPYYRVRIGAFAEGEVAEGALEFVSRKYPNAFISRGTVTVMR